MHKLLIFIALIVFSAVNAFGQHFRNYNSEYVVFTEQIDSSLLKKQLQQHELKIKKLFSKRNHHLGKDSIRGIIENTFFYYVSCYEIAEEKEDTIYLKPYKKQLIKYFKLIHNDLEIGCFGDLGNLSEKGRYGSTYFEVIDKQIWHTAASICIFLSTCLKKNYLPLKIMLKTIINMTFFGFT